MIPLANIHKSNSGLLCPVRLSARCAPSTPPYRPPPTAADARTASGGSPELAAVACRQRGCLAVCGSHCRCPLHFLQPHLAPELSLLCRHAPRYDRRVLLEEAHQLLARRDALPI